MGWVGDWELHEAIGQGGMGIVYAATHQLIEGEFAVKMLRPELARDQAVVKRFLAEVQKARLLDHPNIVRMEIPFRAGDAIYLPMERLRGRSLGSLMTDERGPWPIDRTVDHMFQAACGLGHAHARNVLHRDVKPENLFVTTTGRVKLLDFGLAKQIGDQSLTSAGMAVGTPVYMAPEILRGKRPVAASDLYSLGVILFRLLTGKLPIPVQDSAATLAELFGPVLHAHAEGLPRPSTVQPDLPRWLDDLATRLLDDDPAVRPESGTELARLFEQHGGPLPAVSFSLEEPAPAPPPEPEEATPLDPSPPPAIASGPAPLAASAASLPVPPRQPAMVYAAIIVGVALGGFAVGALVLRPKEPALPQKVAAPVPAPLFTTAFSSEPPGAMVMVEGKLVCPATPCRGELPGGNRYVTMRLERYEPYDGLVAVKPGASLSAKLRPKFATLSIQTKPPGVVVLVNGDEWGPSPLAAREVEPGVHLVEVRDRRFGRGAKRVLLERGDTRTITITAAPPAPPPKAEPEKPAPAFDEWFDLDVPRSGSAGPSFDLEP